MTVLQRWRRDNPLWPVKISKAGKWIDNQAEKVDSINIHQFIQKHRKHFRRAQTQVDPYQRMVFINTSTNDKFLADTPPKIRRGGAIYCPSAAIVNPTISKNSDIIARNAIVILCDSELDLYLGKPLPGTCYIFCSCCGSAALRFDWSLNFVFLKSPLQLFNSRSQKQCRHFTL